MVMRMGMLVINIIIWIIFEYNISNDIITKIIVLNMSRFESPIKSTENSKGPKMKLYLEYNYKSEL